MELDEAIKERHSVRRFTSKKPSYDDIIAAIEAANTVPLAGNFPSLRFILVTEQEKINAIAEACQQSFVAEAPFLVVVCSDVSKCVVEYGKRGEIYSRQQAGASIENFLLKVTDLGLASCWVGAFVEDMVRRVLVIPGDINIEAVLPIGYEMPKSGKQRKKRDLDWVVFYNKWKLKYLKRWKTPEPL